MLDWTNVAEIPVGTKGEKRLLVTPEVAVDFMGLEEARVLGTPYLIGYLEMTAHDAVQPLLEAGYDTVGTHVDVRHLAATPVGMAVTFRAEVTAVNDRRITKERTSGSSSMWAGLRRRCRPSELRPPHSAGGNAACVLH